MALVFDIEVVGEVLNDFDEQTRAVILKDLNFKDLEPSEYDKKVDDKLRELAFSPYCGQVVAVGCFDTNTKKGAVFFQSPEKETDDLEENQIRFRALIEPQILSEFWRLANSYDEFVSFNGRMFDAPYLMIRSAIHKIRPTKDLMAYRYSHNQARGPLHYDLYDLLSFYGAAKKTGGLHLACRAFGIKSPKNEEIDGSKVAQAFRDKKFLEIARYNAADLTATADLFDYWRQYLRF